MQAGLWDRGTFERHQSVAGSCSPGGCEEGIPRRGRHRLQWVQCSLKAMWMMLEGRDRVLWERGVQAPDSHLSALSLSHVIFRTPENLRPCLDYSKKRPHLYNSVCLFSEATLWNPPQYI